MIAACLLLFFSPITSRGLQVLFLSGRSTAPVEWHSRECNDSAVC